MLILLLTKSKGFHRERSIQPKILALRRIIKECKIRKKRAAIVLVDFSKAFDSINREASFHIIGLHGIPAPPISKPLDCYTIPNGGRGTRYDRSLK